MFLRVLALSIAATLAPACNAAVPGGRERGEALVAAAQQHLDVPDVKLGDEQLIGPRMRDLTDVHYDWPTGRFATYLLTKDGRLKQFVVNQRDVEPYAPVKDRRAFIERLMEIAAPESSKAERAWGAMQLDMLWGRASHPLPVQVGGYVFKGITGRHDTFTVVEADAVTTGLKYRPLCTHSRHSRLDRAPSAPS